jgi:hypothetical protein
MIQTKSEQVSIHYQKQRGVTLLFLKHFPNKFANFFPTSRKALRGRLDAKEPLEFD